MGDKLHNEVTERDVRITELQSGIQQLNNAQIESMKEKAALCTEINELCNFNNNLSHSLLSEHQKAITLDETREKMEFNAQKQVLINFYNTSRTKSK